MSDAPTADHIWVLGLPDDDADSEQERSLLSFRSGNVEVKRQPVPTDRLRKNLGTFLDGMREALGAVPDALGGFTVETVEISAEISVTGTVSLLGTGGEVAGTGGIAITLKRTVMG